MKAQAVASEKYQSLKSFSEWNKGYSLFSLRFDMIATCNAATVQKTKVDGPILSVEDCQF